MGGVRHGHGGAGRLPLVLHGPPQLLPAALGEGLLPHPAILLRHVDERGARVFLRYLDVGRILVGEQGAEVLHAVLPARLLGELRGHGAVPAQGRLRELLNVLAEEGLGTAVPLLLRQLVAHGVVVERANPIGIGAVLFQAGADGVEHLIDRQRGCVAFIRCWHVFPPLGVELRRGIAARGPVRAIGGPGGEPCFFGPLCVMQVPTESGRAEHRPRREMPASGSARALLAG
jgi:hypothetical protein